MTGVVGHGVGKVAEATLHVQDVTVRLDRQRVVTGASFTVEAGQWLGLIGPNGAGKSSLLRALAGIVDHDGTVQIAEQADDGAVLRRRPTAVDVAVVPQRPVLPDGMTVAEYVLLARTAHRRSGLGWLGGESDVDRQVTARVLTDLDLAPFADRYVSRLSGGEAQRVVLARALAQEPSVLLLDEPTSALDVGHQFAVLELVDRLRRITGLTVVAAMHDLTLAARFSHRLVLLAGGRIQAEGPPDQVLLADRLSAAYGTDLTVSNLDGDLVVLPAPSPSG